jgi:hypothetical protein
MNKPDEHRAPRVVPQVQNIGGDEEKSSSQILMQPSPAASYLFNNCVFGQSAS